MSLLQGIALFVAAVLAGALNSVAGGGSFISFPTLWLIGGVPPINANATNTVALWPGSVASIPPYRRDLEHERRELVLLTMVSVVGGVLGAIILLRTPPVIFEHLVPYLLLLATLVFAFGSKVTQRLRRLRGNVATEHAATTDATDTAVADNVDVKAPDPHGTGSTGALIAVLIIQFMISIYGGFFGGGIGIMMLAGLSILGLTNIHAMNALKVVLASVINGVAFITFTLAGAVWWPQALLMIVGSIAGGYGGAVVAHMVPSKYIRWLVIFVGFAISTYIFIKQATS